MTNLHDSQRSLINRAQDGLLSSIRLADKNLQSNLRYESTAGACHGGRLDRGIFCFACLVALTSSQDAVLCFFLGEKLQDHLALFFGGGLGQSPPEKRNVFAPYKPVHVSASREGCELRAILL